MPLWYSRFAAVPSTSWSPAAFRLRRGGLRRQVDPVGNDVDASAGNAVLGEEAGHRPRRRNGEPEANEDRLDPGVAVQEPRDSRPRHAGRARHWPRRVRAGRRSPRAARGSCGRRGLPSDAPQAGRATRLGGRGCARRPRHAGASRFDQPPPTSPLCCSGATEAVDPGCHETVSATSSFRHSTWTSAPPLAMAGARTRRCETGPPFGRLET